MTMPDRGPTAPVTDALTDVRFELLALNDQIRELLGAVNRLQPQITVEPAPVVVSTPEAAPVSLDLSPLLAALDRMSVRDDDGREVEELKALRKDIGDLGTAMRAIAGSSGGTHGIGASVVNAGGDFPVMNSNTHPLHVTVDNFATSQTVTDFYTTPEILADQAGAAGVLTFTFTSTPKLIWVKASGGNCRTIVGAGTPTASFGIPCDDGVPQPITVQTQTVKVYAPSGATVSVWGYS